MSIKIKKLNYLYFAIGVVSALLCLNFNNLAKASASKKVATVNANDATLRQRPDPTANYTATLPKGETVTIIAEDENYYYISSGKEKGYIKISDAKIVGTIEKFQKAKRAKISADDVNMRTKPNVEGNIIIVLKKGSIVEVTERANSWFRVFDGKQVGYVDCEYIEFLETSNSEDSTIIYSTLKMGMNGKEVLKLQKALAEIGMFKGEADGNFGAKTREAVEKYKLSLGIGFDGTADETMLSSLYLNK